MIPDRRLQARADSMAVWVEFRRCSGEESADKLRSDLPHT